MQGLSWSEQRALRAATYTMNRFSDCGIHLNSTSRLPKARACIARNVGLGPVDLRTHGRLIERVVEAHRTIMELYCVATSLGPGMSPRHGRPRLLSRANMLARSVAGAVPLVSTAISREGLEDYSSPQR